MVKQDVCKRFKKQGIAKITLGPKTKRSSIMQMGSIMAAADGQSSMIDFCTFDVW